MTNSSLVLAFVVAAAPTAVFADKPNFVILFADDLGYGDLSCYGHPSIRTPNLDRMASEGVRFTDFYSAAEVCTPSRAALLTGRYPVRSGMCETAGARRVLFPDSEGGLPSSEVTLAEALKENGYATAHIGKWHLGIHPGSRPLDQGFDSSLGLPYSNDMDPRPGLPRGSSGSPTPPSDGWNVPLIRDSKIIERPVDQSTLTKRYTEEAKRIIQTNKDRPFFLYLAYTMPHVPLFASPDFVGRSPRGIFGDVVEEIDWSVGEIASLRDEGLADNTFVLFTSDNGPWLTQRAQGGSAGLLRGGKGSTWEGGMRVPGILWMPGRISAGVSREQVGTLDVFPTVLALAGLSPPEGVALDGRDITSLVVEQKPLSDAPFFYYRGDRIFACRIGPWKAHYWTREGYGDKEPLPHDPPLLFHLPNDPSERLNVAGKHPDILAEFDSALQHHRANITVGEPQLK